MATICLLGWIALTALHIGANLYLLRFRIDVEDNLLARKHVTQVRVLLRALDTVIVLVTLGFALMTFDAVRQYGVSLFASAGVAGVVFGLAAQPVLSNLIAGVQIAVTQPIRLEDAVTVQNEYGWIEEINATYVVIRLWDLRRLIVPLNYFIQQPFYNWTRQAAPTIGSVVLYLDYTAPVDVIRAEGHRNRGQIEAVERQGDQRPGHQCQRAGDRGARSGERRQSPRHTSNLCAELREKLIGFLQREHPEALPRQRNEIVDPSASPRSAGPDEPARSRQHVANCAIARRIWRISATTAPAGSSRRLLDDGAERKQRFFLERPADQLQAERQALRIEAARHRNARQPGHVHRHREHVVEIHLDRIGAALFADGERRRRRRRRQDGIDAVGEAALRNRA